jgi:poly-D-alanine transfer protein DltD
MKLKYVLTPIVIFLVLVIVFSARPPETVSYYEIEHGVKVDSSTPNVMDAFTVQAYLRNNNPRTVQVEPFRYQFDIIDIRRVDYHVDTI